MMPFGATSYKVLGTFDDSAAQLVAFDERVRCYRRRLRQTNPGNAKKLVKENCAFKQCDSRAGTTMWTIAKAHQTSGKSAILNPSVRIEPVRTESRGRRVGVDSANVDRQQRADRYTFRPSTVV